MQMHRICNTLYTVYLRAWSGKVLHNRQTIYDKARNLESWYFCDFVVKRPFELEKCELDTNSENVSRQKRNNTFELDR